MSTDPYVILEKRIRTGEYRPGVWLDPERRLAEEFGVNRGTIRRAIARLADAGLVTCEPGHRPVVRPPQAGAGHPFTVALLMGNEPLYHAFQVVVRGCEPVLRADGLRLLYMDTWSRSADESRQREVEALRSLVEHPVSAVITWCQHPESALPHLRRLQERAIPVIAIDRQIPGLETDFVGIDNVGAARSAVQHLLSLGHRRIGLATRYENTSPIQEREAGFRESVAEAGLPVDESCVYRFPFEDSEAEETRIACEIIATPDKPTAIFAVNDILALRLAQLLEQGGLSIPGDMALMGFDDLESFTMSTTGLTSVHQSYEVMGRQAARLVVRRLQNPSVPLQHILLETRVVARSSTVPVAADVPHEAALPA